MYEFKNKIGKVLTSKSVGTGPSSYEKKRIYRAEVSQRLRNADLMGSDPLTMVVNLHTAMTNTSVREMLN